MPPVFFHSDISILRKAAPSAPLVRQEGEEGFSSSNEQGSKEKGEKEEEEEVTWHATCSHSRMDTCT